MCSSPPRAGGGGAFNSLLGPDPEGVSLPGRSLWVLSPQKASSFPRDTPALLHPAPYPCSFSHFFLALLLAFYFTRKEGCFLFHQHVLPWWGGGRETKYVSSSSWLLILPWTGSLGELFRCISVTLDVKNLSWRTREEKTLMVAERNAVEDFLK